MVERVDTVADLAILSKIFSKLLNEYQRLPRVTISRIGGQQNWDDISGHR